MKYTSVSTIPFMYSHQTQYIPACLQAQTALRSAPLAETVRLNAAATREVALFKAK
jgi:hypothetical protein